MKRVCVFSGSSPGADLAYRAAANDLGHGLAERGIELVYGGAHVGLMGASPTLRASSTTRSPSAS